MTVTCVDEGLVIASLIMAMSVRLVATDSLIINASGSLVKWSIGCASMDRMLFCGALALVKRSVTPP